MAVGGWTVKLYMNMEEVVAILSLVRRKPTQLDRWKEQLASLLGQASKCLQAGGADKAACRSSNHVEVEIICECFVLEILCFWLELVDAACPYLD